MSHRHMYGYESLESCPQYIGHWSHVPYTGYWSHVPSNCSNVSYMYEYESLDSCPLYIGTSHWSHVPYTFVIEFMSHVHGVMSLSYTCVWIVSPLYIDHICRVLCHCSHIPYTYVWVRVIEVMSPIRRSYERRSEPDPNIKGKRSFVPKIWKSMTFCDILWHFPMSQCHNFELCHISRFLWHVMWFFSFFSKT